MVKATEEMKIIYRTYLMTIVLFFFSKYGFTQTSILIDVNATK